MTPKKAPKETQKKTLGEEEIFKIIRVSLTESLYKDFLICKRYFGIYADSDTIRAIIREMRRIIEERLK